MTGAYRPRLRSFTSARRDKELSIRFTIDELESVRAVAAAAGLSMADFVRRRLLEVGANTQITDSRPVIRRSAGCASDPALVRQVAGISSNLNQIARAVNKQALQSQTIQVVELLVVLLAMERQVCEICMTSSRISWGNDAH